MIYYTLITCSINSDISGTTLPEQIDLLITGYWMLNTWQFLKGNQLQSFPSASDLLHALFHRNSLGHWFGQGKNTVTEWVDSGASILCLYIVFYNLMILFFLIYTYLLFNISCSYHLSDTQSPMYFFCWGVINIHSFIHSISPVMKGQYILSYTLHIKLNISNGRMEHKFYLTIHSTHLVI